MDELERVIFRDLQKFMVPVIKLRVKDFWGGRQGEYYCLYTPTFDNWRIVTIIKDECLVGYVIGSHDHSIRASAPEVFRVSLARANYRELFQEVLLEKLHRRVKDQANHHAFKMQVSQAAEDTEEHSRLFGYYMETERVVADMLKEMALEKRRAARNNS